MNVLQLNTVYPNGSTGRIAAEIAVFTVTQPNACVTATFGIGNTENNSIISAVRIGNSLERKLHAVVRKLFDAEGYGSWFATGQLIRLCKQNNINLIHMHNLHGCYINLKRWFRFLKQSSIPVIWTLHDCWSMTGHCAYFSDAACEKWKTQCKRCPEKYSYPECIGIDGSRRNYSVKKKLFTGLDNLTIVTPCRWLEGIVKQSYFHKVSTRVIYNGVDTARFYPRKSDLRRQYGWEGKRLLVSVASDWDRRKGLDALVILDSMLDDTFQIVIIGLTSEQISRLPQRILGLERTASQEELAAWYTAADCLVNPTLDDTMPLVNLEALACGTPIVVYKTGGCPEAVAASCGAVVEKGDVIGLAHAVKQICDSELDYTDACIRQAKRFEKQVMVQAYFDLYREVAG